MVDTQSVKIEIPEALADISVEKYKKFIMMATEENGDEQALYHFCGLTPDQQENMKKKDMDYIKEKVAAALNERPALVQTFTYRSVEYGFHPKLEDISMGEYVDLDELLKEPYKNAEKVLGILYRPITKKMYGRHLIETYDPDKHNGLGFQDLSADIFLGCLLFFYRLEISLLITFLRSSQKEEETNQPLIDKLSSQGSGVGMAQSIRLLEVISQSLMK
tara:strand:- start:1558 stop:2214 length:657 start_codon:yes stop_codon:yes gene_type:complete